MNISKKGMLFISKMEGLCLAPYLDAKGVPTIGYGNTRYPNKDKVTMDDEALTPEKATALFNYFINKFSIGVNNLIPNYITLTQNQFDALVSFAYNVGISALSTSTLLREIIKTKTPDSPSIKHQFMRWNKIRQGDKYIVVDGLTTRRESEASLYFK